MQISCPNCNSTFRVPEGTIKANGRIVRCSNCTNEWLAKAEPESSIVPSAADSTQSSPENSSTLNKTAEPTTEFSTQPINSEAIVAREPIQPIPDSTILENVPLPATINTNIELSQNGNEVLASTEVLTKTAVDETPIPAISTPKIYIRYEAPKIPLYDYAILRYLSYLLALTTFLALASYKLVLHHAILVDHFPQLERFYERAGIFRDRFLMIENIESRKQEIKSSNNEGNLFEVLVDVSVRNIGINPQTLAQLRFTVYNTERKIIATHVLDVNKLIENDQTYVASGRLNRLPPECTFVTVDLGNFSDFIIRDLKYININ